MSWEDYEWEVEERLERELVEWAVRKAFLPPPWFSRGEGAEKRQSRDSRKATWKELKVKISVNPSQWSDAYRLLLLLAEKGYVARARLVRLGDLLLRLVPHPWLRARGKIVRIELEIEKRAA